VKRLRRFEYHEPAALTEAVAILTDAEGAASVLAGGTDLVVDMKTGRLRPEAVVNLKHIPGLAGIEETPGGTRIGALTPVAAIEHSATVAAHHPALAGAAAVLATPPVRAMATIGGNVGRASPASDLGPPLIVHRAAATIHGPAGEREEPVEDLYAGPGALTLQPGDIITSFFVPISDTGFGSAHLKIGPRLGGTDIAMAGVSAGVTLGPDGTVESARIVLSSVAPTPLRAVAAEGVLDGERPSPEVLAAAGDAAAGECSPIGDLRAGADHRIALVRVLTRRALQAALTVAEAA
jgi:carbon-monoxide dehydrogenase medium subunit